MVRPDVCQFTTPWKGCHSKIQSFYAWGFHVYIIHIYNYIYIHTYVHVYAYDYIWYVYSFRWFPTFANTVGHGTSNHWDVECRPNFAHWNGNLAACDLGTSPLKIDGWMMRCPYWGPAYFQGFLLLVLGRVDFLEFIRWWCDRGVTGRRFDDHGKKLEWEENLHNLLNLLQDFPQCLVKYCWWLKSCTSWYGEYPTIYKVLYIPGG